MYGYKPMNRLGHAPIALQYSSPLGAIKMRDKNQKNYHFLLVFFFFWRCPNSKKIERFDKFQSRWFLNFQF